MIAVTLITPIFYSIIQWRKSISKES